MLKLKHINRFRDRHGKLRYYCRRPGSKSVPLPGLPGTAEFMVAYQAAMAGDPLPLPVPAIGAARTIPGTANAFVTAYLDCTPESSSPFKTLAAETQRTRRNILENFRKAYGDIPVYRTGPKGEREMLLTRPLVQRMVNQKAITPHAQRNFLNTLRAMFEWAVDEGRLPENPCIGVKRSKAKTAGYKTWTEEQIERFEAHHAVGTKARLAFALLLFTGQRRGDVVQLGRKNVQKGVISLVQEKTKKHVDIPIHPELQRIIEATPTVGLKTFLVTSFGKPYTAPGFGNAFRDWCNEAGCPDVAAHGLRKACAVRLADLECSTLEIASITGHTSLAEIERYTREANRKRLAVSAMKKLSQTES
jgi:integrase